MTIALLLIASVILMGTMLFLTVSVNDLEKKSVELAGLLKKRYTLRNAPKSKKAAEAPAPAAANPAAPKKP